ncbi:MAG: leucine-rich repeat domain-containing protein, partial [Kiritimatiellaeota bacterium]|nr:leucine-rich repeat domain-containing protein [Kiritimatiellota bacterium]
FGDAVTNIGSYAFYKCDLAGRLVIPDSVRNVGEFAFYECNDVTGLTLSGAMTEINTCAFFGFDACRGTLVVPGAVTNIGLQAFTRCGMDSLVLGANVERIGGAAFAACPNLAGTLTIPNAVRSIDKWAFLGCDRLTGTLAIPDSVEEIGERAFMSCGGLEGLSLGNSVTNVGEYAFYECFELTGTLKLSESLQTIGDYAFARCFRLTGELVIPDAVRTIGEGAFGMCVSLSVLDLGTGVTDIGDIAFYECLSLIGTLVIPDSVKDIGYSAFAACEKISGLSLGNSVTNIGVAAFSALGKLVGTLDIPDSVANIGHLAFSGSCLSEVSMPSTGVRIGDFVFVSSMHLATVHYRGGYPDDSEGGMGNLYWLCDNVTSTVTHENVAAWDAPRAGGVEGGSIEAGAATWKGRPIRCADHHFIGVSGDWHFEDAGKAVITNAAGWKFAVRDFGGGTLGVTNCVATPAATSPLDFSGAVEDGYAIVSIGNNSPSPGTEIFHNGQSLRVGRIAFPTTLTNIGDRAFQNCSNLVGRVDIPDAVTYVGYCAFADCPIAFLRLGEGVVTIGNFAFSRCALTGTLYLPDSVKYLNRFVFEHTQITEISMPSTGVAIDDCAFTSQPQLRAVIFRGGYPASVSGTDMYWGTSDVTSYVTSASVADWNANIHPPTPGTIEAHNETWQGRPIRCHNTWRFEGAGHSVITNATGWKFAVTDTGSGFLQITECIATPGVPSALDLSGPIEGGCTILHIGEGRRLFDDDQRFRVTSLALPTTVTNIDNAAFLSCFDLAGTIDIPGSVKTIGELAFGDVILATRLKLGEGVTDIGDGAFAYCASLSGTLTIPDTVKTIGAAAFANCFLLGALDLGGGVANIDDGAFFHCYGLAGTLAIPNTVTNIGEEAFSHCFTLGGLTLGNSVTNIGPYAFYGCTGLSGTLDFPDSVRIIENYAFHNCNSLGGLTFGSGVAAIGSGAFGLCTRIEGTLALPGGLLFIGIDAFADTRAKRIIVKSAPRIGQNAFHTASPNLKAVYFDNYAPFLQAKKLYDPHGNVTTYVSSDPTYLPLWNADPDVTGGPIENGKAIWLTRPIRCGAYDTETGEATYTVSEWITIGDFAAADDIELTWIGGQVDFDNPVYAIHVYDTLALPGPAPRVFTGDEPGVTTGSLFAIPHPTHWMILPKTAVGPGDAKFFRLRATGTKTVNE